MKTIMRIPIVVILLAGLAPIQRGSIAAEFFVATSGSDDDPGTPDKPFATVGKARDVVRQKIAAGLDANVTVCIRGGTYELAETLRFGAEDSGTDKCSVTYAAQAGETVILGGGRQITGWRQGEGKVWTAKVPGVKEGKWYFRHLFVDGRRATRARTPNVVGHNPHWQLTGATLSSDLATYTLTIAPERLGEWSNVVDMEIMVAGNWAINRKRIAAIDKSSGTITLTPPHASGHQAIRPGPGRYCYFENAPELLDFPGEWYLDRTSGVLSYIPREGEDMQSAKVVAPVLERLIEVTGTADRPVRNVHFKGLQFQYATWLLPPHGYLGIQGCHFTQGRDWSRPWARIPAAICFNFAQGCSVTNGAIAHVGGCGIEMIDCCHDNVVQGNQVFDVSGNGIMLGGPREEGRVPRNNRIANNHVHECGAEYYGAAGIWVGFADGAVVAHNLVHELPYSGISVGWQWNPQPTACKNNIIECNHVYDVMKCLCDGGCIYTLGFQPGTIIRGNHLHDVHRSPFAQGAPNNGMFIDQGSKGYLFERNVIYRTAAELVRFNQCARDWHTWKDNHIGKEADVKESGKEIIKAAGLEEEYRR